MTRFFRSIVAPATAALCLAATSVSADLVVLQYHHVDDSTPRATSTTPSLFRDQLDMIRELDLEVVPLLSGTRQALSGEMSDSSHIAITFDDAYESVYNTAAPLLSELELPYTIFVNTDAIGSHGYMTWQQLREVADDGRVTIANHSADHGHLARKPDESRADWQQRVTQSLDNAQDKLEKELDQNVPMFAYPYGEFDKALEKKLESREWLGFGQQSGPIGRHSHHTRLPRFPMADAYGQLENLKDKLLSKAFPVPASELPDGIVENNPPTLTFALGDELSPARLTCFASGFGRIDMDVDDGEVVVQAPGEITSRRFRYNCTHPAGDGSFYWLSQQWLNLDAPED
ncbi:MAG: polysaccharide deacetylase family protein [Pseudomonadota bacterium]